MGPKELASFAKSHKLPSFVSKSIEEHEIDGRTALILNDDDLEEMANNSRINLKKLIAANSLLRDAVLSRDNSTQETVLGNLAKSDEPSGPLYLLVNIISATGLKKTDGIFNNSSGDPYVKVILNDKVVGRTRTVGKTTEPIFNEVIEVEIPPGVDLVESYLALQLYDDDKNTVQDIIGQTLQLYDDNENAVDDFLGQVKLVGNDIYDAIYDCENENDEENPLRVALVGEKKEKKKKSKKKSKKNKVSGHLLFRLALESPSIDNDKDIHRHDINVGHLSQRSFLSSRNSSRNSTYSDMQFSRSTSRGSLRSRSSSRTSIYSHSTVSEHKNRSTSRHAWYEDGMLRNFNDVQEFIASIDGMHLNTDLEKLFKKLSINTIEDLANMLPQERVMHITRKLSTYVTIPTLRKALRWTKLHHLLSQGKVNIRADEVAWVKKIIYSEDGYDKRRRPKKIKNIIDKIEQRSIDKIFSALNKPEQRQWAEKSIIQKAKRFIKLQEMQKREEDDAMKLMLDQQLNEVAEETSRARTIQDWLKGIKLSATSPLSNWLKEKGYAKCSSVKTLSEMEITECNDMLETVQVNKVYMVNNAHDFEKVKVALYQVNYRFRKADLDREAKEKKETLIAKKKQIILNAWETLTEYLGEEKMDMFGRASASMDYESIVSKISSNKTKVVNLNRKTLARWDDQGFHGHEYEQTIDEDIVKTYRYDKITGHRLNKIIKKDSQFKTKSLSDDAAKALAVILQYNTQLQTLYLNNNKIGDEGAIALGKALLKNKKGKLKNLYIYNNDHITSRGEEFLHNVERRKHGLKIHCIAGSQLRDSYTVMITNDDIYAKSPHKEKDDD